MAHYVSPLLDFLDKNPMEKSSYLEASHQMTHLESRKKMATIVGAVAGLFAVLALIGLVAGGHFVVGALGATAAISAGYVMLCKDAQKSLHQKLSAWVAGSGSQAKVENPSQGLRHQITKGYIKK